MRISAIACLLSYMHSQYDAPSFSSISPMQITTNSPTQVSLYFARKLPYSSPIPPQIILAGSGGQYPCSKQLLEPVVVLQSESGGNDVVGWTLHHVVLIL
jgi:hypothetical protein